MERIAVLTRGLWRLRREIAALTGCGRSAGTAWLRPAFDAVAGLGARADGPAARAASRSGPASHTSPSRTGRCGRSGPGRRSRPVGMVDGPVGHLLRGRGAAPTSSTSSRSRTGSRRRSPSARERALDAAETAEALEIQCRAASARPRSWASRRRRRRARARARPGAQRRLDRRRACRRRIVPGDACRGDRGKSRRAEIVVKLHPDVLSGRRAGYFSELRRGRAPDARRRAGQSVVAARRGRQGLHGLFRARLRVGFLPARRW